VHHDNNNSKEAISSSKQTKVLVNSATSVGKASTSHANLPVSPLSSKEAISYATKKRTLSATSVGKTSDVLTSHMKSHSCCNLNKSKGKNSSNLSQPEFIASKREEFYALHHSSDVTRLVSSQSKIQYQNENIFGWLAESQSEFLLVVLLLL
jgi:hypothetical protein